MVDALLPEKSKDQYRVLIIDDEKYSRTLTQSIFAQQGCETIATESGEEAMQLLEKDPNFDFVMLDLLMVGIDGFETLSLIKNNPRTSKIKVIILSALDDNETRDKAFRLGAVDYINKPLKGSDLISHLQLLLKKEKSS